MLILRGYYPKSVSFYAECRSPYIGRCGKLQRTQVSEQSFTLLMFGGLSLTFGLIHVCGTSVPRAWNHAWFTNLSSSVSVAESSLVEDSIRTLSCTYRHLGDSICTFCRGTIQFIRNEQLFLALRRGERRTICRKCAVIISETEKKPSSETRA